MIHVLVETNWVVDVCAPGFERTPEALRLLEHSACGHITIHIPHIALREARSVIRRKFQPKESNTLQQFRKWAVENSRLDPHASAAANQFLALFSNTVRADLDAVDQRIGDIVRSAGVEVFALNDAMFARSIALRDEVPDPALKPFDETILAAVLVRTQELGGEHRRVFCTADLDLVPFDRRGAARRYLKAVYDQVGIEVRSNFILDDIIV